MRGLTPGGGVAEAALWNSKEMITSEGGPREAASTRKAKQKQQQWNGGGDSK